MKFKIILRYYYLIICNLALEIAHAMHGKKDILVMDCLASCERNISGDCRHEVTHGMIMPGALQDKHKNFDPEKGIPVSRRNFNMIYMILEGVQDVLIGTDSHLLKPNDIVIVPENMVYASRDVETCSGYCIHFRTEFIKQHLHGLLSVQFPYFDMEAGHIIHVPSEESLIIQKAFRDILDEYKRFSKEKEFLLKDLVHILLLRLREVYRPHTKPKDNNVSRNVKLCNQFLHLAENNFLYMREVKHYAELLNITPQYLSDVVKATLGNSPRKLITRLLVRESMFLLAYTDKSLSEIAFMLRFNDPAHFSHFIQIHTGCSPSALRKKI
jgi:AraC-like DNA-binding protein/mannose-6-phosphate isomerase-like protein (cupin superfamily)